MLIIKRASMPATSTAPARRSWAGRALLRRRRLVEARRTTSRPRRSPPPRWPSTPRTRRRWRTAAAAMAAGVRVARWAAARTTPSPTPTRTSCASSAPPARRGTGDSELKALVTPIPTLRFQTRCHLVAANNCRWSVGGAVGLFVISCNDYQFFKSSRAGSTDG